MLGVSEVKTPRLYVILSELEFVSITRHNIYTYSQLRVNIQPYFTFLGLLKKTRVPGGEHTNYI